jgi:hypothetical protein
MKDLSSRTYQYPFINLGKAFKRFFQGLGKRPRLKRKGKHDSFTIDQDLRKGTTCSVNIVIPNKSGILFQLKPFHSKNILSQSKSE